jgi:hypothetical protein
VVIALSSSGCIMPAAFQRNAREVRVPFIPALLNCQSHLSHTSCDGFRSATRRLTITSSLPKVSTAFSTSALTSLSLAMSTLSAIACTLGDCEATIPAAFSAAAKLMSAKMTLAPSAANNRQDSRPIPLKNQEIDLADRRRSAQRSPRDVRPRPSYNSNLETSG